MIQFISTGPNGNPGGESRFPPSCKHGRSGGHTTKLLFFFFFLKKYIFFPKGPWEPVLLLKKIKKSPSGGLRLAKSSGGRISVPDLEPRPGQRIVSLRGSSGVGPHGGEIGFTLYAGGVGGG